MTDIDKTLEAINRLLLKDKNGFSHFHNPGDEELFLALIKSVPDDIVQKWSSDGTLFHIMIGYTPHGKSPVVPRGIERSPRQLKRPISQVIADFQNLKSGKRTEAKNELMERFPHLDWKEQLAVFEAILDAAEEYKTYRQWLFKTLREYFWDDMTNILTTFKSTRIKPLQQRVRQLCISHLDEFYPALFAIQKFDIQFVQQHQQQLAEAVEYYAVARRLMELPDFQPDRNRLVKQQEFYTRAELPDILPLLERLRMKNYLECGHAYYYLMARFDRQVDAAEARRFMYEYILHGDDPILMPKYDEPDRTDFSLMYTQNFFRLMKNFGRLGLINLILEFQSLEQAARQTYRAEIADIDTRPYTPRRTQTLWQTYLTHLRLAASPNNPSTT